MNIVVIPVVVGRHMTERAVRSALVQDIGDVRVVVIGNGCVDGTVEHIRAKFWGDARVIIIAHSMRSLNWVWNRAIEHAMNNGEQYVLIINNDVELRTDTYRLLVDDGGLFVTGVSVGDAVECTTADPSSRSPHPDFSCFLIRKECWQRVGRFDERFFAYCSDLGYHLRMHRAGVEAYSIAVPFYHERSSTIRLASNELRDELQRRADHDRVLFKEKWGVAAGSPEYMAMFEDGAK